MVGNVGLASAVLVLLVPSLAHAQGFGIYEQGACAMASGGAAVADPCSDGSAVYVNPAGIVGQSDLIIGGGGVVIAGLGSFTSDTGRRTPLESPRGVVPHGYFVKRLGARLAVGGGVYVPYGLGVKWPLDFEGRFLSYDSTLSTFYLQPTVAFQLTDRVAIGGGPVVAVSSVALNRREDLATVPLGPAPGLTFGALVPDQTDFVDTRLSAKRAVGVGANMGVLITLHDRARVGARYLTSVNIDYSGTATFSPIRTPFHVTTPNTVGLPVGTPLDAFVSQVQGALQSQAARTALEMPAQLTVGISVRPADRLTLLGDYQWVGWSAFKTVTLDFSQSLPPDEQLIQNYRDTSAVRIGARYDVSKPVRLSAGYFYNQAAAPDETVTPLLPEARRQHTTVGLGWDVGRMFTFDVAYQFIGHADRRGRTVNPTPGQLPTTALNGGVYRSRGDLVGVTLTYRR